MRKEGNPAIYIILTYRQMTDRHTQTSTISFSTPKPNQPHWEHIRVIPIRFKDQTSLCTSSPPFTSAVEVPVITIRRWEENTGMQLEKNKMIIICGVYSNIENRLKTFTFHYWQVVKINIQKSMPSHTSTRR